MQFAEIIPLLRLPNNKKTFSYHLPEGFSNVQPGSLVIIPWRKQELLGIVDSIHGNKPTFKTSPIHQVIETSPSWTSSHLKTLKASADHYSCSYASLAELFIPNAIKSRREVSPTKVAKRKMASTNVSADTVKLIQTFTAPKSVNAFQFNHHSERLLFYRKLLSQSKGQMMIICPQKRDIDELYHFFTSYLQENDIVLFDKSLSKSEQWTIWQKSKSGSKLILTTRAGLFLPCQNLNTLIIDQSEGREHKSWQSSPRYDIRTIAKIYAEKSKTLNLFFSSSCQSLTSEENSIITQSSPAPINTVFHEKSDVLHPMVLENIKASISQKQNVVIISTLKSFARTIHCLDCHHRWNCPKCQNHLYDNQTTLRCASCEYETAMPEACPNCSSLRIRSYGHGIASLKAYLDEKRIPVLTTDEADIRSSATVLLSTPNKWRELCDDKNIGQVILFHPETRLFAPDFRANELFFHYITHHRLLAHDYFGTNLTIQTGVKQDNDLYQMILNNDWQAFLQREQLYRKGLSYPPFGNLTEITLKASETDFEKKSDKLLEWSKSLDLKHPEAILGPNFSYRQRNITSVSYLLKTKDSSQANIDKLGKNIYNSVIIDPDPIY